MEYNLYQGNNMFDHPEKIQFAFKPLSPPYFKNYYNKNNIIYCVYI